MLLLSHGCCLFQSLQIFRVYFSDMERASLWQVARRLFQCLRLFQCSKKILCRFQLREVGSHISSQMTQWSLQTLISQQHLLGWGGNTIRTPITVEKLRTAQGCICPDAFQCSTSKRISFQNTDMGRQLQLSGRCVLPSGRYLLLVFYIGNILVDKNTLCNGCFLIGLSVLFRVFK
jgi:hypothetical protein